MDHFKSLAGQFLVAMPSIDDLRFEKAVIYIYMHSPENGAAGLVINRLVAQMSFTEILDQLHISHESLKNPPPLLLGGPDQVSRGYILHSTDYRTDLTLPISTSVSLTATQDILEDIANQKGPQNFLVTLGCATWVPGQLEDEIMSNIWLTTQGSKELLFETPFNLRWNKAMEILGIEPILLSSFSGKA